MSSSRNAVKISSGKIIKKGFLKKLKPHQAFWRGSLRSADPRTMKKKFFVLRGDSPESNARLEYYDSEKKWKNNHPPKKCIVLKTCFNINKRSDTRHKWVIGLYIGNDCFSIVLESEEEMEEWLKALIELQNGEPIPEGEPVRPTFEHVWQVTVLDKELGGRSGILGPYHLCLTDQTLSLVRISSNNELDSREFSLQKIKRCGHVDNFFYMEVGQCTVTGAGNLWMDAEDNNIAENMHTTILSACGNCSKKDNQPKLRNRSSSANESSKPVSVMQKWPTHTASSGSSGGGGGVSHQRTYSFPLSPLPPARRASTGTRPSKLITTTSSQSSLTARDRCDSLPSRARTTSEGAPHYPHRHHLIPSHSKPYSSYNKTINCSPPVGSSPVSPASGACSTDSAGSSLSMDGDGVDRPWDDLRYTHSQTPEEPVIIEENSDDYAPWGGEDAKLNNYMLMDRSTSLGLPIHSNSTHNCPTYRKYSPNPSSNLCKSSSPSQGSYMEMYSPCGSSPLDSNAPYLPMSPGDNKFGRLNNSVNHSRGNSLVEDGYVPMVPPDYGYVDMDHGPASNNKSGSSCSITSGTPSTDIRFIDYPLDKVSTYFPPEDDMPPPERPTRAYSVGSRPNNNDNRIGIPSQEDCERVRAFSVGSKNTKILGRVGSIKTQQLLSSSHSSVEPCDDLMELDFSKKGRSKNKKKASSSNERLSVPGGSASTLSSAASSYSTAEGSYMEMSPRASPSLAPSPPKISSRYFPSSLFGKSPPKNTIHEIISTPPLSGYPSPSLGRVLETEPGYVEMTAKMDTQSSPPVYSSSPKFKPELSKVPKEGAYVEMKPGSIEVKPIFAKNQARIESFPGNHKIPAKPMSSVPIKPSLIGMRDCCIDSSLKRKKSLIEDNNNSKLVIGQTMPMDTPNKHPPDDYMEMNLRKDSWSESNDYMDMSYGRDKKYKRKDRRYSSQPISIKPKDSNLRKNSTGTLPKVPPSYLPLESSPPFMPGRPKGGYQTTPTSGGSNPVIFPFSPTSSPGTYDSSPKCPVDATSGTLRISSSEEATPLTSPTSTSGGTSMSNDYVNYDPSSSKAIGEEGEGEYTLMGPMSPLSEPTRKTSEPAMGNIKLRPIERILSGIGSMTVSSPAIVSLPPAPSESQTTKSEQESPPKSPLPEVAVESKTPNGENSPKEIHYASLDLKRSESEETNRNLKSQSSLTESSSTSTPSPNVVSTEATAFNYAEIDFSKSAPQASP